MFHDHETQAISSKVLIAVAELLSVRAASYSSLSTRSRSMQLSKIIMCFFHFLKFLPLSTGIELKLVDMFEKLHNYFHTSQKYLETLQCRSLSPKWINMPQLNHRISTCNLLISNHKVLDFSIYWLLEMINECFKTMLSDMGNGWGLVKYLFQQQDLDYTQRNLPCVFGVIIK